MPSADPARFRAMARDHDLVPVVHRMLADHLTPVLAYRRLVSGDQRTDTSFLLESVEVGGQVGRYSILAARPRMEVSASGEAVRVQDHQAGTDERIECQDPMSFVRSIASGVRIAPLDAKDDAGCFQGGWAGWLAYDSVRWLEPDALGRDEAPRDDRDLPDMHLGLYELVLVFDHVDRTLTITAWADVRDCDVDAAQTSAQDRIAAVRRLVEHGEVTLDPVSLECDAPQREDRLPGDPVTDRAEFEATVERCIEYVRAGDVFQVVPSQRFDRVSEADPFDVYRALRVINPSPYMIYMQSPEVILVASSPEILCRVADGVVTSRPLAGTRPRGDTPQADADLEADLLADEKERAEHAMLVDLARNDLGRVCQRSSVQVDRLMDVERYSHVMHLSSTVTGRLADGMDCWDALRHALPVGTVSGAPKIRAMQIIDECEPVRRGPYAGGIGCIGFNGDLDVAIALRTIVVPASQAGPPWTYQMQAGAGVVLDSVPESEYRETVNKAAALGRAIDLAQAAMAQA